MTTLDENVEPIHDDPKLYLLNGHIFGNPKGDYDDE
jgi:hypothetical protein